MPSATTEIIKPTKPSAETQIAISRYQVKFMNFPLLASAYNSRILFFNPGVDERKLKVALAATLDIFPGVAGRMAAKECAILLNDAGVPFTTTHMDKEPPTEPTDDLNGYLADQQNPRTVAKGRAPLATVKLTFFPSGKSALGFAACHTLLDGMSVYTFMKTWAALTRGESIPTPYPSCDQSPLWAHTLPVTTDSTKIKEQFLDATGSSLAPYPAQWLMHTIASTLIAIMNFKYLHIGHTSRVPLFLSADELAKIKAAATPKEEGAWVTTQEALSAFLLQTIGRLRAAESRTPVTKPGALRFFRDTRSMTGLKPDHILGVGFMVHTIQVDNYLDKSLAEVAAEVHRQYASAEVPMKAQKQLATMNWLCAPETGIPFMYGAFTMLSPAPYDLCFGVNNQSKVTVPDFGFTPAPEAPKMFTTAGPNLYLPADGGVHLYLDPETLPKKLDGGVSGVVPEIKKAIADL